MTQMSLPGAIVNEKSSPQIFFHTDSDVRTRVMLYAPCHPQLKMEGYITLEQVIFKQMGESNSNLKPK